MGRRWCRPQAAERLWKKLFVELYGEEATALRSLACKRAGGWRQLLGQKKIVDKSANGWERLCPAEMAALLETLCGGNLQHSVILLVDGSGSVQEGRFAEVNSRARAFASRPPVLTPTRLMPADDFATMVTFIKEAADAFRQAAPAVKVRSASDICPLAWFIKTAHAAVCPSPVNAARPWQRTDVMSLAEISHCMPFMLPAASISHRHTQIGVVQFSK